MKKLLLCASMLFCMLSVGATSPISTISSKSLGFITTNHASNEDFNGESLVYENYTHGLYKVELKTSDLRFYYEVRSLVGKKIANIKSIWEIASEFIEESVSEGVAAYGQQYKKPIYNKQIIDGVETLTERTPDNMIIRYVKNGNLIIISIRSLPQNGSRPKLSESALEKALNNLNLNASDIDMSAETSYYSAAYGISWKSDDKINSFYDITANQYLSFPAKMSLKEKTKGDKEVGPISVEKRNINGTDVSFEYCKVTLQDQKWNNRIYAIVSYPKNGELVGIFVKALYKDEASFKQTVEDIFSSVSLH